MRTLLVITACAFLSACGSSNPNRDLCVGGAALEYQEAINVCKSESLSYDECVSKYDIEADFERKQKDCR